MKDSRPGHFFWKTLADMHIAMCVLNPMVLCIQKPNLSLNLKNLILQMFRGAQCTLKVGIKTAYFIDTTLSVRSRGETASLSGAHCVCAGPQREQRKVQRNLNQNVSVKQY